MTAHPRAVADYAAARGLSQRAAEAELLLLAGRAKPSEDGRKLRYRDRTDDLDVSMWVEAGRIVAVTVRRFSGGGSGSQARRHQARIERRRRERGEE